MDGVTVIIPAYSMDRWELTCSAIRSALNQGIAPKEIIVCVDHNPELVKRFRERWAEHRGETTITIAESRYEGHQSASRTTGVELASTELLAFLDDDATAEDGWLERLLAPLADRSVRAVGGAPIPDYPVPRPRWFPSEFNWIFGCAYSGLPTNPAPVLRIIGTTFAARRSDLVRIGGFHFDVFEDMDMCHRLLELQPHGTILYEPRAVVRHYVHPNRLTWEYFCHRTFWVNRGKVAVMKGLGSAANLRADRRFAARALTTGLGREFRQMLKGDTAAPLRIGAIAVGLFLATAGYLVGNAELMVRPGRGRRQSA